MFALGDCVVSLLSILCFCIFGIVSDLFKSSVVSSYKFYVILKTMGWCILQVGLVSDYDLLALDSISGLPPSCFVDPNEILNVLSFLFSFHVT